MYWDAHNLYGWAMVQYLPYKGLRFVKHVSLSEILQAADDSRQGYIIECDLFFPPEIHDKLKEFVPAPETLTPNMEWLSDYQRANDTSLEQIKNGKYMGVT